MKSKKKPVISPVMRTFSDYIAAAPRRALPADVREKTRHHVIDTLAAIISGSRLGPGVMAIAYAKTQGGPPEAGIPGTTLVMSAVNAAQASGIAAHADETDDSHQPSNTHPGCAVVPTALALGERERCDGNTLLRAVATGYDANCRLTLAFDPMKFKVAGFSNHSFGGMFGANVAAAVVARLNATQVRHLLSYASQQCSGMRTFERDPDHMLKAFAFGGMTARNGVSNAQMVKMGFTGVDDEFEGARNRNLFDVYAPGADRQVLVRGLGKTFEIMRTNIKKWSVGSPNQAALDSLEWLMQKYAFTGNDVAKLIVTTPDNEALTVSNSPMPDICMQHLLSLMLVDGTVTFESSHVEERMQDPAILAMRRRIELVASAALTKAKPSRQAIVEVHTKDGRTLKRRTYAVRGTPDNPMPREEVDAKSYALIAPVVGKRRARALIDAVWNLEKVNDIRVLRKYYQP
jgi:2-methylcitrate dehydratase PrpD